VCASCHRLDGRDYAIPPIADLSEEQITRAMLAYRSGERPSHIMQAVALSLSDEEIATVAHFLAARRSETGAP
jgi:cytochrome subunit of sulfide dehydrogenase